MGGFHELTNSNPELEIINRTFNMHFSIKPNKDKFSYSQRIYLYKIDSLCTDNNINLIVLTVHKILLYKMLVFKCCASLEDPAK